MDLSFKKKAPSFWKGMRFGAPGADPEFLESGSDVWGERGSFSWFYLIFLKSSMKMKQFGLTMDSTLGTVLHKHCF